MRGSLPIPHLLHTEPPLGPLLLAFLGTSSYLQIAAPDWSIPQLPAHRFKKNEGQSHQALWGGAGRTASSTGTISATAPASVCGASG